jgi:hypothetical protein
MLGLDMIGPLTTTPGGLTHMLVAIDKFTKWIEYKPITCYPRSLGGPTRMHRHARYYPLFPFCKSCTKRQLFSPKRKGDPFSHHDLSDFVGPPTYRTSQRGIERRSWNKAGPYPVMPTNLVMSEGSGMALGSSLAYTRAVFVRPNGNWPHGEHGGDSGVPLES